MADNKFRRLKVMHLVGADNSTAPNPLLLPLLTRGARQRIENEVVHFSVLGDAGATYTRKEVKGALLQAPPLSIVLMHMNHPQGETAEGLIEAIPELKKKGFRFVKLSEYPLR